MSHAHLSLSPFLICEFHRRRFLLSFFWYGFFLNQIHPSLHGPSEPTVFENYVHDITVDDQLVELSLWDTAGVFCRVSYPDSTLFRRYINPSSYT